MAKYNPHSRRATEARAGKILNMTPVRILLIVLTAAAVAFGVACIFLGRAYGWILIGLAAIPFEILIFAHYELSTLPVGHNNSVDDLLSNDCLVYIGKKPTPQSIAKWFTKTRSGHFLALRYGISPRFMELITAEAPAEIMPQVFDKAIEIREKTNSVVISGGVLAVAIIECHPNYENILHSMKLEISDLYNGITWFNYLYDLVKGANKQRHTGGIGRDLMFGYTPTLQRFAQNISKAYEARRGRQMTVGLHEEHIQHMIDIFSKTGRQNVALVGPEGSGRGTIVDDFAARILDADNKISSRVKFRQVFKLDASALISATSDRSQLEALVTRIFNEAFYAKNIILWLDNANVFMEDAPGSIDISSILLPVLEGGGLRLILTLDQQRFLEISTKKSTLANTLNTIMVSEASAADTMKVMQDRVPLFESQHNAIYTHWALAEAYRLSERYVHDLVMPGRALNMLDAAGSYPVEGGFITDVSVQQAIEKTYGVKMQSTQNDEDKDKLLNLEQHLHARLIGQDLAVQSVSDALRRAAAGVRNENRPIGTFLFLGPTGVGKTELAKAISDVYFGGEGQIVRIDLNEYVSENDVSRLIADGATDELSLAAQVMKRPFSVVLLDEIEKAHPLVLTTLLQLLDEGVLRDIRNREVSFRDAIVIATSNAGANLIRDYIDRGVDASTIKDQLTNELISSGDFKPEFLNRFDEICVFQPLDKESLAKIVDLIIKGVNKTLEPNKIAVQLDEAAKAILVERGYDPKLGARPMKRIVSKTVENIVARNVLSGTVNSGETITITADMVEAALN